MRRAAATSEKRSAPSRDAALPLIAEVFRLHGYEGASLSQLTEATGLGKGSLYNFFPGGKEQMAAEVIAEIDGWFERNVFAPLRDSRDPANGIAQMFDGTVQYFHSGRRVCLVGMLALGSSRDVFANQVHGYFERWRSALASALRRAGSERAEAARAAEAILLEIQGALVLARATGDPGVFTRTLKRLRRTHLPA
jgi:AcrR family transcriptional regulator